ncbi:hypothetical protein ACHAP7_005895 [Fusarium lateritium]
MRRCKTLQIPSCMPSRAKPSPQVETIIDGHYESKVYTTGTQIRGSVRVTVQDQTEFETIQVTFKGITSTSQAFHYGTPFTTNTFVQIRMPISEELLPPGHKLEPGEIYDIYFIFEIPEHLSPDACSHQSTVVRERHLHLPPSIGSWEKNDITGGSIYVDYTVCARLVLGKDGNGKDKSIDHSVSLKVIPILPEQPPINVTSLNSQYCLSQTKTIRKNLLGAKAGTLRVSSTQPRPISLQMDHLQTSESELLININYAPSSSRDTPPELYVKQAAIETVTSFWLGPIGYLPDHDEPMSSTSSSVAPWTTSHPLLLQGVENINWERDHNINPSMESERRASEPFQVVLDGAGTQIPAYKAPSATSEEFNQSEPATYKTTIIQPFRLPSEKLLFIPTFHSCMVSRTYRIRITLAASAHGTTLSLIVPLQITSEGFTYAHDARTIVYCNTDSEPSSDSPPPYSK